MHAPVIVIIMKRYILCTENDHLNEFTLLIVLQNFPHSMAFPSHIWIDPRHFHDTPGKKSHIIY